MQYFTYKRKEYLFYGIYLFVLVAYYTLFTTDFIIVEEHLTKAEASTLKQSVASLAVAAYVVFIIYLLDPKRYSKILSNFYYLYIALNILGIPLYICLFYLGIDHQQFYYYSTIVFGSLSFYVMYKAIQLKVPYTNYVLLGTLIATVGGIWSIILSIQKSTHSYIPGQFSILVDIILFFYATQKKVIDLQSENIKLKFQSITELQEERQRISAELHDEVGGGLSTIHLLSELSKNKNADSRHIESISKNSTELVQKMNEIVWALNVKNDSLKGLIAYMRQYVVHTLDELNIDVKANIATEIKDVTIDGKNRREIFLLIKELVNNIIKHSQATQVFMDITVKDKTLHIQLQDNGIGFDDANLKPNNFGIIGMKNRIVKLKGFIQWHKNNGTMVAAAIPLQSISYKSAI
jgi:signal transduction histidine kinase